MLLIDEVLAVGDASFQQKCFDEFNRLRDEGKTIVLVTHDMGAVRRFCHRAMLMERGEVVAIGDPSASARSYLELNFHHDARSRADRVRHGPSRALRRRHARASSQLWIEDAEDELPLERRAAGHATSSSRRTSSSTTTIERPGRRASRSRTRTTSRCSPPTRSGSSERTGTFQAGRPRDADACASRTCSPPAATTSRRTIAAPRLRPASCSTAARGWLVPGRSARATPAASSSSTTTSRFERAGSAAAGRHAVSAADRGRSAPPAARGCAGPSALTGDWRRTLHLTWTLAYLEFRLKFFGSVLGYLWQLGRPLMLFGVYYVDLHAVRRPLGRRAVLRADAADGHHALPVLRRGDGRVGARPSSPARTSCARSTSRAS